MNIEKTLEQIGEQITKYEKFIKDEKSDKEHVPTNILMSVTKRLYEVINFLYRNPIERINIQGTMKQKIQAINNNYKNKIKNITNQQDKEDEFKNLVNQSIGLLARGYDNLVEEIASAKSGSYDKSS